VVLPREGVATLRATRFSAKLAAKLIRERRAGATIEAAARKVGIGPSTLYLWLEYGDAGMEPYRLFAAHFRAAKVTAESAFLVDQYQQLQALLSA
jgi:transposase-like protein